MNDKEFKLTWQAGWNAALERAATLVEEGDGNYRWAGRAAELAAAIRALITKDSGGGE